MFMKNRIFLLSVVSFVMALSSLAFASSDPGAVDPDVMAIFNRMTAVEKVGQLFMVTFQGKDISSASDIYQLVSAYRVGGVLLSRENGNWRSGSGEAAAVFGLSNGLQKIEADSAAAAESSGTGEYIPLFIALPGGGDGYPNAQLVTDLTDLTSPMSIGASWQPQFAEATGNIIGRELSLLGVNMYLGPALDVLERPNPGTTGDLGARSFGGDPFWVGKMGQAYIQGIQLGSGRKMAVIATHFPGIGASDRSPEEEVATVRKAMQDLQAIDLAPYAQVARTTPGTEGTADGFVVSHIRYQGLQGNIRYSTRPVSLDPQALNQLMALPEFTAWREGGGITVSGSLGAQSMRKFYESTGTTFSNKHVALNAFQAGNDILQLSDFSDTEEQSGFQAMADTIRYFQQNYKDDVEFAGKVDQAVLRILSLKKRLYPVFSFQSVIKSEDGLESLKQDAGVTEFEICKAGVTMLSPNPETSGGAVIEAPTSGDRVVVLTDSRMVVPCPSCAPEADISTGLFADTILKLYGPGASGLIIPTRIQSYTFKDLSAYLQGVQLPDLDIALKNATVIVALIRTPSPSAPESYAFQNLLAQQPSLIRNKHIYVFALGAPYYLDSTEISKLYAYYALYSKNPSCIEVGARVLLGDITPAGASPVSVGGTAYELLTELSPDPDQVIQVSISPSQTAQGNPTENPTAGQTSNATPTPMGFMLGDLITIYAGPVLDHNQHIVPDGTIVRFQIDFLEEGIPQLYLEVPTANGTAQTEYALNREGQIQVSASSEPAKNSTILQLTVGEQLSFVTAISPTRVQEFTPTVAAKPTESSGGPTSNGGRQERAGWDTLLVFLLLMGAYSAAVVGLTRRPEWNAYRWRILLAGLVGGLAGYDLLVLGFTGVNGLAAAGGRWMSVVAGSAGGLLGAGLGWGSLKWRRG
jgi:beta-N-acetylhexosaminidase